MKANYKCDDCGNIFSSNLKKLDAICPKCRSLKVDYTREFPVKEEMGIGSNPSIREGVNIMESIEESKKLKVYYAPDTVDDVKNTDLLQLSRKLLDSVIVASGALNLTELDDDKRKEMELVLKFLNATNNIVKTKMQYFKMVGVGEKIDAIKKLKDKASTVE